MLEFDLNQFLVLAASGQTATSGAAQKTAPTGAAAALTTSLDFGKILVVPLVVWFIKEIVVYSFGRFNLIRHFYAEIELEVEALRDFLSGFEDWKRKNIDCNPPLPKSKIELRAYTPDYDYPVFDGSRPQMVRFLWGKEITKLREYYRKFRDIQVRITSVFEMLKEAEETFLVDKGNKYDLMQRTAKLAIEDIKKLVENRTAKQISDGLFYAKSVYFIPAFLVALLVCLALWLLGIIG